VRSHNVIITSHRAIHGQKPPPSDDTYINEQCSEQYPGFPSVMTIVDLSSLAV
jgi:hypothetical protein